jgi:NADH-quinone oxidoreductase subunit M
LVVLILWFGIYPATLLNLIGNSVEGFVQLLSQSIQK